MNTGNIFENLDKSEIEDLEALPIYISVLIAGADGTINLIEVRTAVRFTESIEQSMRYDLVEFYSRVNLDFEDKLKMVMANMPQMKDKGRDFLINKIEKANTILEKMDSKHAYALYDSFKELAIRIAYASGGIFGFGSISVEESKLIELQMIQNALQNKVMKLSPM